MAAAALDHRAEARRAGARLHPGADRPLRPFRPQGRPRRGLRHSSRSRSTRRPARSSSRPRPRPTIRGPRRCSRAIEARGGKSAFLKYLGSASAAGCRATRSSRRSPRRSAWGPLMRKRITRLTAETLPWYLRLYGVMVGATIPGEHHQPGSLCGHPARRALRPVDDGRPLLPRDDRQEADARGGAAAADPRRPPDLQRAGLDLGAGRQGRGLGRRAADAGAGADQQGDGRLPHPHAATATAATASRAWPSCSTSSGTRA